MKQYYLRITSKNEKSLKSFLNFFSKYSKTQFNVLSKSTSKKKKKKQKKENQKKKKSNLRKSLKMLWGKYYLLHLTL